MSLILINFGYDLKYLAVHSSNHMIYKLSLEDLIKHRNIVRLTALVCLSLNSKLTNHPVYHHTDAITSISLYERGISGFFLIFPLLSYTYVRSTINFSYIKDIKFCVYVVGSGRM